MIAANANTSTLRSVATPDFGVTSVDSNIELNDIAQRTWDVIILGAGTAGASAAILSAKRGLSTLLIEAKSFPREKVCGGCLNQRAQASLERIGVLSDLRSSGAIPIDSMHLQILGTSVRWAVPEMLSVRRSTLDTILVKEAMKQGACYVDMANGTLQACIETDSDPPPSLRRVRIQKHQASVNANAKCVLVACGLTRSALKGLDGWPSRVQSDSRIGVQCILPESLAPEYADGQLHMIAGRQGYVGLCKTDGNVVDVAAAIDPSSISPPGGISQVIRGILSDCQAASIQWPDSLTWSATPALTRSSSRVSDHRVLLIGDAIGYVEPFTGEGMAWAFASSEAVMPLVEEIANGTWNQKMEEQWFDWACRKRIYKQKTCRWIAKRIRRPHAAAWVLRACNWIKPLRATILRKTTQ